MTSNTPNSYRNLKVWQKSVEFAVLIYKATEEFPKSEQYGLTSQMRRSVVSISSNIAEGQGRGSNKEFAQFLKIALGSCLELETQLLIANKVDLLDDTIISKLLSQSEEIKKMIYSLEKSIRN